mgnify:CR=1 FL=1
MDKDERQAKTATHALLAARRRANRYRAVNRQYVDRAKLIREAIAQAEEAIRLLKDLQNSLLDEA